MAAQDSVTASGGMVKRKDSERGKQEMSHLRVSQTLFRLDSGWSAVPLSLGVIEEQPACVTPES